MMNNNLSVDKKNHRIAIFCFYDRDGKVDRYVDYMLSELQRFLARIVIVVNGILDEEGEKILSNYSKEIIKRENTGWDVGAWKDILLYHLTKAELAEYEELVLFNDTFYGPVFPFDEMFNFMEKLKMDFWGITAHGNERVGKNVYPWHLQSFFMVFRRQVFLSECFYEYWMQVGGFQSLQDVVNNHERVFTQYLIDHGFQARSYVETADWDVNDEQNVINYYYNPYALMTERRCPIVKRKLFTLERGGFLDYSDGGDVAKIRHYIEEKTNYDFSMVVENLLRLYDAETVVSNLNSLFSVCGNTNIPADSINEEAVYIIYAEKSPLFVQLMHKVLSDNDSKIKVYFLYDNQLMNVVSEHFDDMRNFIEMYEVSSLRDGLVCLLEDIKTYSYLAICTDQYYSDDRKNVVNQQCLRNGIANMCISSLNETSSVVATFKKHKTYGVLFANPVLCDRFYGDVHLKENGYFDDYQGFFWIRRELLQEMLCDSRENSIGSFELKSLAVRKRYLYGYLVTLENLINATATYRYTVSKKYKVRKLLNKKNDSFQRDYLLGKLFSGFSIKNCLDMVGKRFE